MGITWGLHLNLKNIIASKGQSETLSEVLGYSHLLELHVVEGLLPDHVELPHVLDLALHLVHMTWMGRGCHTETFFLEPPIMVKIGGVGGGW